MSEQDVLEALQDAKPEVSHPNSSSGASTWADLSLKEGRESWKVRILQLPQEAPLHMGSTSWCSQCFGFISCNMTWSCETPVRRQGVTQLYNGWCLFQHSGRSLLAALDKGTMTFWRHLSCAMHLKANAGSRRTT